MKTLAEIEAQKMMAYQKKNPGLQVPKASHEDDDEVDDGQEEQPGEDDPLTAAERRIADLQHQMAALQGRLSPAQQQGDEYRRLYTESERARAAEREELEARVREVSDRLEQVQSKTAIEDLLSEEERDMFDPEQLAVFAKSQMVW